MFRSFFGSAGLALHACANSLAKAQQRRLFLIAFLVDVKNSEQANSTGDNDE
jgi:hypothetical protein